ncbi:MAG TPA: decaprenyl-phosphate phosphoribosyltransferase [Streptosporangiaceae bacterium]|jgi:decaprenyl-phosphate phosphoribosyltransferase|nr:decaprenyl-phosphate phosphoribosyltransferase [Streptosporangiaceae bacterium]
MSVTGYLDGQGPSTKTARSKLQFRMLFKAARPRQAIKNLVVFVAPFAAGALPEPQVLGKALIAAVAFSAAAAGIYLLNDVIDVSADRAHPTKRLRPVAAGLLSPQWAIAGSVLLLLAGGLISFMATPRLIWVVGVYIQLQIVYCLWLRSQPVIDLCLVSTGFVLRVVAGAVATDVPLSSWLLFATAFGSLFMVSGRRYAEMSLREQGKKHTRTSLERYTSSYIRFVWSGSAIMSILAYLTWTSQSLPRTSPLYSGVAAALFIIAILRYALDVDRRGAGTPENIAFSDRGLQALAFLWLVFMGLAVYS